MTESGFLSLTLFQSQSPVTISKTAILFVEENNSNPQITHLHCVGGITHIVNGLFTDIMDKLPKFILSQRNDNGQPRILIHDWNVSYVEKTNNDSTIVYFTERGVSVSVLDTYDKITTKLHSL